jgi:hypothetical protein
MLNEHQRVLSRLAAADRWHQKEAGGRLLLGGAGYACGVVLAAFVADVVMHLGVGWRLGLLAKKGSSLYSACPGAKEWIKVEA